MLYILFILIAIAYNLIKFRKERDSFLSSIVNAKHASHREMILSHHFYIFIFESFLALIVAHLITEKAMTIGILGLGFVYICLVLFGLNLYQYFIRYIERHTQLELYDSFESHLLKELRVNFALIMLPILVYSAINWAFQDSSVESSLTSFIGVILNIIFVSVLTIFCSVTIMLRLIPNREITESEYLDLINKRLAQISQPNMRVRWIETDIKNAYVVGLKLLKFSNQTMFIGSALRSTLTIEEFDAVIAHEIGHVANRHIHRRVIDLIKNFLSVIMGVLFLVFIFLGGTSIYFGEDVYLYSTPTAVILTIVCMGWMFFNYTLVFDSIRSHEYEADAYAVMELGASFEALKSALQKLATTEELPEYLKQKTPDKNKKGLINSWISKVFSTHPELDTRIKFLEYKISHGLPFNYYVSKPQKIKHRLSFVLNWRVSIPLTLSLALAGVWTSLKIKDGRELIALINTSSTEQIIKNKEILNRMNSKPQLIGHTTMYYVVRKKDERLIDFFLNKGADKGKTLMYISQLKDYQLLERYYLRLQSSITEADYFLLLRKTAQTNFTEGYRLLINGKRFEQLDPAYKEDVSRIYETRGQRSPASIPEKR